MQVQAYRQQSHHYLEEAERSLKEGNCLPLHINFYENWLTPGQVREGLEDVRRFLDKLTPLIALQGG